MKLTLNQLKSIIELSLFNENYLRDKAISGIISLLRPAVETTFENYNYTEGICDQYDCNASRLADQFIDALKNHEIIQAANVVDILKKLTYLVPKITAGSFPSAGTAEGDVMALLKKYTPQQIVIGNANPEDILDKIHDILADYGLADSRET